MKTSHSASIPIADVPDARRSHLFFPERVPLPVEPLLEWPGYIPEEIGTAWHLASLSHAGYHEETVARTSLQSLGWELEARVERDGIRADLVRREGVLVLSCCGTRPRQIRNLRSDVDAVFVPHPLGGRVHRGFFEAWSILRSELKNFRQPAVATGHSLGGALAILAAAEGPEIGAMVFGSPRVGDLKFSNISQLREVMRYQGAADVVCQLPPERLGFAHAGSLTVLADSRRWIDPSPALIARLRRRGQWRFALRFPWLNPAALWFRELADHAIHNYTKTLGRLRVPGHP